jgi:tagaturonate reductase
MKTIKEFYKKPQNPIKVIQFGEGNFMRGFIDYLIDVSNEKGLFQGDVVVVKPRKGSLEKFNEQKNIYTVSLRGLKNGKVYVENRLVHCIQKVIGSYEQYDEFMALAKLDSLEYVVSNTTEAGIVYDAADLLAATPPTSYPAKLTKFLYERFQTFHGDKAKGLILLPLELIEGNGQKLKECILDYSKLWQLEEEFTQWICSANTFCDTLVDRIVAGYPKDEVDEMQKKFGYRDDLLTAAEPFGLWVVEPERDLATQLPWSSDTISIVLTKDLKPYRDTKVRILNGAHTSMVLGAYLAGHDYVRQCMEDETMYKFISQTVMTEIVPTVQLPKEEAIQFANSVFERFQNPFVKHALLSIALNSVSKWRTRILPTFKDHYRTQHSVPKLLTFSFAALIAFYRSGSFVNGELSGSRDGESYVIQDDPKVMEFIGKTLDKPDAEFTALFAKQTEFWGEDLTLCDGFVDEVSKDLATIKTLGMNQFIKQLVSE